MSIRPNLKHTCRTTRDADAGEQEFFARLGRADILVHKRFSTRNPGEVTGYAVALPHDTTRAGDPVWFGGGKLAADLTLPKLRSRWQATGPRLGDRFTAAERAAIWEHAARTVAGAAEQIRDVTATDPSAAADAAWAAADTLHAAAAALGSGCSARRLTPTTAQPAPRTAGLPLRVNRGTTCAAPPGYCPPSPPTWRTHRLPK